MKQFHSSSRLRRFSLAHVALVHWLVALLALPPGTIMADMLTNNVLGGGAGGAAGTPAATAPAAANAVDSAAAAAQARANAQDMLTRNTMALQAVTAMQEAARAAAATMNNAGANPNFPGQTLPDVPNGLVTGGLEINGIPAGANAPQQSLENARTIVTIQQTQQQAMLNWKTFNVGRDTTVRFDQSAGGESVSNWIAFNTINDPSGNPTQILGSIEARGQVYLINQNGIIFGGGAQVNTGSLVASSLPLNNNLVTRGLLNNPDSQFLFSANAQPAGTKGPTPAYTPPSPPASGRIGNVTVQAGARITAPTTSANVGGRVALIGPNVTNEGTISTPDGQAILAAGMEVGFDAHSSDDPSLRGLDVYVGSVGTYGGTATNSGLVEAPRGSIVISGKNVNQNGFIESTTSVALNGRVDLLANYNAISNPNYGISGQGGAFIYKQDAAPTTGVVSAGPGSVTRVLPEYASTLKVVGSELALKSQVNMQGLAIYLGTGAVVHAPNANVTLSAGVWDVLTGSGNTSISFVHSSGQAYLDQNAVIDVAGSAGIASSISQYIIEVDLRAAELADVPLQRNGSLRGQTVTVDLRETGTRSDGSTWYGTPLANLTGYLGIIQRNVGELTTKGGNVSISAGESMVMQQGSRINIAGGYQEFTAGSVKTTRLIDDGNLVDIARADPSVIYDGIFDPSTTTTDSRWGITTTSDGIFNDNSRLEIKHLYGAAAGNVSLKAAAMALDGSFTGGVVAGPQQLDAAPKPGSLMLQWQSQLRSRAIPSFAAISPTPPAITFRSGTSALPAAGAFGLDAGGNPLPLRVERRAAVDLAAGLLSSSTFGSLFVTNGDGDITLPVGLHLAAPVGGTVSLHGANVNVHGSISAPAGVIDLLAYNISPFASNIIIANNQPVPPANSGRGIVTIGSGSVVSTAGLVLNDRGDAPAAFSVPRRISGGASTYAGGSIRVEGWQVDVLAGSLLDVSGGVLADRSIHHGNAGTLSLFGGRDPLLTSILGGRLALAGSLRGLSGALGGAMTLLAPVIQVGGAASVPNTLLLDPSFYSQGGFQSFTMTGLGTAPGGVDSSTPAIIISPGAVIAPVISSLQANLATQNGLSLITLTTLLQPEGYRNTVTLDFRAPGVRDSSSSDLIVRGLVDMTAGSRIVTDALGKVTLHGQTVRVAGSIEAPGGVVLIHGSSHYPENSPSNFAITTVVLGDTSRISTAGKTLYFFDILGRRSGTVHAGGSITVEGNLIADAGSRLDVSGTAAMLDLTPEEAGSPLQGLGAVTEWFQPAELVPTLVMSNAGSIALHGGEFLFSRATLLGQPGGANAQGGTLRIDSGRFYIPGDLKDDRDITLVVAQDMSAFALPVAGLGIAPGIPALGYFGANTFQNGSFDSLQLSGNSEFRGAVTLNARGALSIADGGIIQADASTTLTAAHVKVGLSLGQPVRDEELLNPFEKDNAGGGGRVPSYFNPAAGTGHLNINADLVETGFLSLQGIGSAAITARQELRGSGYLDIAGNLDLVTGQIVPETASTFTITVYNGGAVSIASSGITPEFPLSAGGRLSIYAQSITQSGVLRAPFGSIRIGWDGTGTAPRGLVTNANVPVTQQATLAAGSTTSVSAVNPQTGAGVVIPYGIIKDGTNWIDPTGLDITATGLPEKFLRISAQNVTTQTGSTLDIRGGGELYAYRWVQGNGGTKDILDSDELFAILPGYSSSFAPRATYASSGIYAANLGGDTGYTNGSLQVGDKVYLRGSSLLATGSYTLLPARYALLPGALLLTPDTSDPVDSFVKPGGAVLTTGYRYNSLNPASSAQIYQAFEIAPQSVVKLRAEYTDAYAQSFLSAAQQRLSLPVARGPLDAGYALIGAQQSMQLGGLVNASGSGTARGGRVDVSSPLDIVIGAPGAALQPGKLVLNASLLSAWNAESLLIGGERDSLGNITVRTTNLTLDNAGTPLSGRDMMLAATQTLTFAAGSSLLQTGTQSSADAFVVSGNGALVRVSGVTGARTSRIGVTSSLLPSLTISSNAVISGATVTLDSTNATTLDLSTQLTASAIQINSGRISLQLENPGALQPNAGLVLGGGLLTALKTSSSLSLLSYSSIDFYGSGAFAAVGALELHAGEIRGFNQNSANIDLTAQSLLLDNSALAGVPGIAASTTGGFNLTANTITIGKNALVIDQFDTVTLTAAQGVTVRDTGSLRAQNALNIVTPFIRAESKATQVIAAGGLLHLSRPATVFSPASLGLGASLSLEGGSILAESDVLLPSGLISLRTINGDLTLNGTLSVAGVARHFFDAIRFTDAGRVSLTANAGNVTIGTDGLLDLSAQTGGGNAGTLSVKAANQFVLNGTLAGQGASTGSFDLDVGTLTSFADLNTRLNAGAFTASRELRVRTGGIAIDGTVNARRFLIALDSGALTVNGTINASGSTGGRIDLIASGGVTLANGSTLNVRGQNFDSAGKGGAIWIESTGTGSISIATGSSLDLRVDAKTVSSASRGQFSGKVHLRASQNATFNDLLINPIGGSFLDASSIEIEGFRVYAFNQTNVILRAGTATIAGEGLNTTTIHNNNTSFMANHNAMITRLFGGNTALDSITVLQPGVEIVNSGGSISLGTPTSAALADWNLATFRYGPKNAAGTLTMRASGNLEFYNTLSDGFTLATAGPLVERMWMASLTALNTSVPVNSQSWNLRLTSGADVNAADFRDTAVLTALGANAGSLLLGKDAGQAVPASVTPNTSPGSNALTRLAINPTNNTATTGTPTASNRFQVIRTGTGDIEINAGRDVRLLNQFATIYTAGVTVPSATTVFSANDFVLPNVSATLPQTELGAVQQLYPVQYSMAGGNVSVTAGADILHLTLASGVSVLDSSRQLPNNWLMRRGYVDPSGQYGAINVNAGGVNNLSDPAASTTWWVNFSNFFDGIATLGGGNVTLNAGRDVQNVSAHAPTNARAARGTPSAAGLLELGGGDLRVTTGRNIDGGTFYVERGSGTLIAGGAVTTNEARSISLGRLGPTLRILTSEAWMPVTLFTGKSSFDVSARGDVLLGPVANTFLLPQGLTNRHWYKTYFSTYSADSALNITSLGGNVTLRQTATLGTSSPSPILSLWINSQMILGGSSFASHYQPWLRIAETNSSPFSTFTTLMPGILRASAFSGDINLAGRMNFAPSPTGTVELLASGSINGFTRNGIFNSFIGGTPVDIAIWSAATLNLSDTSPASLPGALSPFSYYQTFFNPASPSAVNNAAARVTSTVFLNNLNAAFIESGSTSGAFASSQSKQRLHAPGLLHAADTMPMLLYAGGGDVSGFTLFSGKQATILASRDITDISFYLQNVRSSDVSIVSAGRDVIAYNASAPLRTRSLASGNLPAANELPEAGDIQINGPGTLKVLAGRNIDLGTGSNNADGTGVGITSIGNGRNPYLPFAGADIVVAAGLGGVATGLGSSNAKFADFIYAIQYDQGVLSGTPAAPKYELDGRRYLAELAAMLQTSGLRGLPSSILFTDNDPSAPVVARNAGTISVGTPEPGATLLPNSINLDDPALTPAQRDQLALSLYFLALRDAGRDRNDPDSPDVNTYRAGYEAIQTLFQVPDLLDQVPGMPPTVVKPGIERLMDRNRPISGYVFDGDIQTQARDIRTKSGGNISILAPGGGLQLASTLIGETLAPPGIITESGGNISVFADQDVSIGIARIFTLRGGDINIWSTVGNIAAGSSSKTVQSAPPTRVLIDPQSASVATDLAGLATGGGIGVLATVAGIAPGNVDLIAPVGAVDAGDAGIRATGNLNIAAAVVLNAANISVGGTSAGTPAAASVASPSLSAVASAGSSAAAATTATNAAQQNSQQQTSPATGNETPSIITVEVLGYGGGSGDDEERRRNQPGE
ncbi:filamentous haemagglutinin family protein [Prosthecobacter sp.]|jgi:filamentous hemagglutinin|uniref:filamentous haemagglutinin family protein n=1 Tax=Prosthecobacter sp. TaxID=1965333 RepID=UPI0037844483